MAMAEAVEARGGAVFVKTPVASIEVDGSGAAVGVRLADGDVVRAPLVVSGLGYRSTESLLPAAHRAGRKLQTDQSCGFVMANIALDGTADELGISSANLWLQPASEANDWDVFGGIDAFFDSPLDVPVAHIPAGITFPSVKDRSHAGARQQPSHHACQILVPACFEWFSALEEESGRGDGRPEPLVGSRHAPPHVFRSEAYAESKAKWKRRLLELLSLAEGSRRIVLLEGPACSGKTSAVRQLAWLRGAWHGGGPRGCSRVHAAAVHAPGLAQADCAG